MVWRSIRRHLNIIKICHVLRNHALPVYGMNAEDSEKQGFYWVLQGCSILSLLRETSDFVNY